MYKLSVIIPVYNCEKYIERAIISVVRQTIFNDIQLIVVDDGSKDNTSDICINYDKKYSNIKYIRQNNSGVSVARNNGIAHSESERVTFLDSDDYVDEECYEKLLAHTEDLVFCSYKGINVDSHLSEFFDDKTYYSKQFSNTLYKAMAHEAVFYQCWNKVYKKSIIDENKCYFPEGVKYAEDMMFVFNYVKYIKSFYYVNEDLYYYYIHEENTTNVVKKSFEVYKSIYDFLLNYFEEIGETSFIDNIKSDFSVRTVGSIYTAATELGFPTAKAYIKNILSDIDFNEVYYAYDPCSDKGSFYKLFNFFIRSKCVSGIICSVKFIEFINKKRGKNNG